MVRLGYKLQQVFPLCNSYGEFARFMKYGVWCMFHRVALMNEFRVGVHLSKIEHSSVNLVQWNTLIKILCD